MNSSLAQATIGLTATSIFFSLAGCSPKDIDSKSKSDNTEVVRIVDGQLPNMLQSQCLMCYGPSDGLSQDVRKQLSKLYPADKATGFAEGELRGWFWVEMQD